MICVISMIRWKNSRCYECFGESKEAKRKKKKRNQSSNQKKKRNLCMIGKLPISDRPFIENHKKLYHDRPFEKGFGIDFYIDQARFLPDNTTLCKIIV